jgi:hypothetical protein
LLRPDVLVSERHCKRKIDRVIDLAQWYYVAHSKLDLGIVPPDFPQACRLAKIRRAKGNNGLHCVV